MNFYLTVALCLCTFIAFCDGVTVKVGEFSFPLESVKQLNHLLEAAPKNPRLRLNEAALVCANPQMPVEFQPLCASPKAGSLVRELVSVAREASICEICANVACSGC